MEETAAIVGIAVLAAAVLYLAYRIRALHRDLQPLIDSTLAQTIAGA